MTLRAISCVLATAALALMSACARDSEPLEQSLTPPAHAIESVAKKRVVFAHQSVGNEVLKGVASLATAANRAIPIIEGRTLPEGQSGIFHFKVGENGDPKGKLRDFSTTLSQSTVKPDIALLKFCYIDFTDSTDATALADEYMAELDRLRAAHPQTRFVAVTAPLTTIQTGPKAWIKRVLGKQPAGYVVNARRHEFNSALRGRFSQSEIFDIAAIESGQAIEVDGKQIQILDPRLTYDGGHLNEVGQKKVAAALIDFLARTPAPTHEHPSGA